ncbi:MAG: cysteine-rich CWC family protein [Pyrinomonadaceae bacterium]
MKLRKTLGFISEKYKGPSVCEACGEEFICGATFKGCWCMNIKLTDEIRRDLRTKYKDCLCRKCLEKSASAGKIS